MAYGNIYKAGWNSLNLGGYIYIDKDGYNPNDGIFSLKLDRDSIEIAYSFDDWNSPIIGLTAAFSIRNDNNDFFALFPLMTASEREYKIRIVVTVGTGTPYTIFEGFLNCDTTSQKYLHYQSLRLTASSYLSKLEYITIPSIDILQNITPIAIIDEMLIAIGHNYNIRINSKLYARGDTLTAGHTLFDVNEFFTELYWEDNVVRKNALYILKSILTSFDCYIYWFNGYWWIERYEDIWTTPSINFVEYQSGGGSSYDAGGEGVVVAINRSVLDAQSLQFSEQSQQIDMIPGYKIIEIQLNDALYNTLINPDLTGLTFDDTGWPTIREWNYTIVADDFPLVWDTANFGKKTGLINNSCSAQIDSAWNNLLLGRDLVIDVAQVKALVTSFMCTVEDEDSENKTILNIKFKWNPTGGSLRYPIPDTWMWLDPSLTGVNLHWYLMLNPYGITADFICQESDNQWGVINGSEADGVQTLHIDKSEFTEDNNYTYEVNLTIPLSEVMANSSEGTLQGDHLFTFAVCLPTYDYTYTGYVGELLVRKNVWGDFTATVNASLQNNLITGEINTKFLNKKTIEVDLFDINNHNYKNGLYTNNSGARTIDWTDDGVNYFSLVDRLLKNKFKLFNSSRQILSGNVIYAGRLIPFQLFTDSKQSDKPFVLMQYSYFPMSDTYLLYLYEYDNTTIINLI